MSYHHLCHWLLKIHFIFLFSSSMQNKITSLDLMHTKSWIPQSHKNLTFVVFPSDAVETVPAAVIGVWRVYSTPQIPAMKCYPESLASEFTRHTEENGVLQRTIQRHTSVKLKTAIEAVISRLFLLLLLVVVRRSFTGVEYVLHPQLV